MWRTLLLASAGVFFVSTSFAANVDVNCARDNQALRKALNRTNPGDVFTIVRGRCRTATARTDDITIQGGTMVGTLNIDDARGVVVREMEIRNASGNGVEIDNSNVEIRNSEIRDNSVNGVEISRSIVGIDNSTITGNGSGDVNDFHCGVGVFWNSTVWTADSDISENTYCGVEVGQGSFYQSFGGDVITQDGCTSGDSPGCGDPDAAAIDVFRNGTAEIRGGAVVTGNVTVAFSSIYDVGDSQQFGDVSLFNAAGGRIRTSVTGEGDLLCIGAFSYQAGSGVACGGSIP